MKKFFIVVMFLVFGMSFVAFAQEVETKPTSTEMEFVKVVSERTCLTSYGDLNLRVEYGMDYVSGEGDVTLSISTPSAPNDVKAFGFDIVFDSSVLVPEEIFPGDLTENFDQFGGNIIASGRVRIGGFKAGEGYIYEGDEGVVAILTFSIVTEGCATSSIQLDRVVDHMSEWTFGSTCVSSRCPSSGDMNADGEVTPADALIVFRRYLGIAEE